MLTINSKMLGAVSSSSTSTSTLSSTYTSLSLMSETTLLPHTLDGPSLPSPGSKNTSSASLPQTRNVAAPLVGSLAPALIDSKGQRGVSTSYNSSNTDNLEGPECCTGNEL